MDFDFRAGSVSCCKVDFDVRAVSAKAVSYLDVSYLSDFVLSLTHRLTERHQRSDVVEGMCRS